MKIFNYDDIYVDVNWRYKRLSIKSGKIEVFSLRLQNIVTSYRKGGIFNPPYVIILSRPPEGFFATPGFDIKSLMVKIQFSDNSKSRLQTVWLNGYPSLLLTIGSMRKGAGARQEWGLENPGRCQ